MLSLAIHLLLLNSVSAERDTTPVFLLDYDKLLVHVDVKPNPFAIMKSTDFAFIIDEAIKLSEVVIVFIEDSFCTEDISLKDKYGSPYYHLSQGVMENKVKYLPSVSQPFNILKQKFQHLDFNVFYLSDMGAKLKIYDRKLKYFYVYFKDSFNETRTSALRRHDLAMREVFSVVRQIAQNPIIAFYTGKYNPIVVETVNFKAIKTYPVKQQPGVTISSSGALFKFIGVYGLVGSRRSMFSQIPLVAEETWEQDHLTTRMSYTDFELEFTFEFRKERWIVESAALLEWGEEVGRTELRVGAPWSWSYTCSDPLVLINMRDGSALTISHYQIQPFRTEDSLRQSRNGSGGNNTHCFGPAVNCGPYFNAQILSGLMVTAFCFGILVYGVVSMYNCHSNDRYDDAHGKPLVIAAEGGANG